MTSGSLVVGVALVRALLSALGTNLAFLFKHRGRSPLPTYDYRTRAYLERGTSEGKTKREAVRALKRHLSSSLYKRLVTIPLTS